MQAFTPPPPASGLRLPAADLSVAGDQAPSTRTVGEVLHALLTGLHWPAPALAVWGGCWLLTSALLAGGMTTPSAVGAGLAVCAVAALGWPALARWRRALLLAGYPLALVAAGATLGMPTWLWLLPMLALALLYPAHAWRDAPLYPTPRRALAGLAAAVPLPVGARVLDAGCGLGHGLAALRREWPQAELAGIEWSWPIALAARLNKPAGARVRRGDLWSASWKRQDVVYLFQRPESMARAWHKACAEMAPGRWLVSLEFEVPDVAPNRVLQRHGAKPVFIYRIPAAARAGG